MIIDAILLLPQEKALVNRYAVAAAENDQKLNQLGLAKNIMTQVHIKTLIQVLLVITSNLTLRHYLIHIDID